MDNRPPPPEPHTCPGPRSDNDYLGSEADPGPCPDGVLIPFEWHTYGDGNSRLGAGHWFPGDRRCRKCAAAHRQRTVANIVRRLQHEAGLPRRYWPFRFERFERQGVTEDWNAFRARLEAGPEPVLGITKWNATAARACRDWTPRRSGEGGSVLLVGPVGGGKTTLAAALANALIDRTAGTEYEKSSHEHQPVPVIYMAETDLYERLAMERANRTGRRYLDVLARAQVLVLDDLGTTETLQPWHRDAIEHLVSTRYNDARPLVITSNLRLDSADAAELTIARLYGERVHSRLVDMLGGRRKGMPGYLELLGMDWRTDTRHVGEARPLPPEAPLQTTLPGMPARATPPGRPPPEPRRAPQRDHAMRAAGDDSLDDDDSND